jgi:hypothetical protein
MSLEARLAKNALGKTTRAMALHRDIYWVGRQWAVTGHGIQACDQKQKGKFDIEASRLWDDGVLEDVRALTWLNTEDFEKALSVARKYYPPGWTPPSEVPVALPKEEPVAPPKQKAPLPEPPKLAPKEFHMGGDGLPARLVPVWRIRMRVSGRGENQ